MVLLHRLSSPPKTKLSLSLSPGPVENITYMCSKVTIQNGSVVRSNCYKQFLNGREIEVCVCESSAGERPCNAATAGTFNEGTSLWTSMLGLMAVLWTSHVLG